MDSSRLIRARGRQCFRTVCGQLFFRLTSCVSDPDRQARFQLIAFLIRECADVMTLPEIGEWIENRYNNMDSDLLNVIQDTFEVAFLIFRDYYAVSTASRSNGVADASRSDE